MRTFTLKERLLARFNLLPLPIYDVFVAPLLGHTIAKAIHTNLFDTLDLPQTVEQIATRLNLQPQATSLLLSTLDAAGYVKRKDEFFSLTAAGRKWFLQSSPTYLGNFVRYVDILYRHWLYLDETMKSAHPPATYVESFGEKEWEVYVYGMMDLARIIYPRIASKLVLPDDAKHLIDLAGSHGLYSIELCKRNPRLQATIVDLPQALKFTQRIVREHNLEAKISLLPGDMLHLSYRHSAYDAALAFNITHGLTVEQNTSFFRKIFDALKPGGVLYMLDQCRHERGSQTERLIPLIVGINIMNEVGGNVYTEEEYRTWLLRAGFKRVKIYRLRLPGVFLFRAET